MQKWMSWTWWKERIKTNYFIFNVFFLILGLIGGYFISAHFHTISSQEAQIQIDDLKEQNKSLLNEVQELQKQNNDLKGQTKSGFEQQGKQLNILLEQNFAGYLNNRFGETAEMLELLTENKVIVAETLYDKGVEKLNQKTLEDFFSDQNKEVFKESLRYFNDSAQLVSDNPEILPVPLIGKAMAEINLNMDTEAQTDLEKVLELDQNNLFAVILYGTLRYNQGRLNESFEKFSLALDIEPDNEATHFFLSKLYCHEDFQYYELTGGCIYCSPNSNIYNSWICENITHRVECSEKCSQEYGAEKIGVYDGKFGSGCTCISNPQNFN